MAFSGLYTSAATVHYHVRAGMAVPHFFDGNVNYSVETLASKVDFVDRFIDGYKTIIVPESTQPSHERTWNRFRNLALCVICSRSGCKLAIIQKLK
jgi:hypothetical protein